MTAPATPPEKPKEARGVTIRRLLELSRPERPRIILATLALFVAAGMNLVFPAYMKKLVDVALTDIDALRVNQVAISLLAVFFVAALASSTRYYLFSTAGERVVARLRERLYRSLITQEIAFFDEQRTGELTNRLASDTTVLQDTVSANVSMLLRNIVTVIGGIGMLLYTSPVLTALMLSIVPPVSIGAVVYGRRVRKLSKQVQDALAKTSEVAEETLSGIRTVRSFAAEEMEAARYAAGVQGSYELARKRAQTASIFMAFAFFLATGSGALVFWKGVRLVQARQMSVGGLIAFLVYSIFVAGSLGALSELWSDFMKAIGAAERVFELMDRVPAIPASGGRELAVVDGHVTFEKVAFSYPARRDVPVLREIDLDLAPGERVALVGPSGAGKSTIAGLIARLYDPDAGRITLDGVDLRELDPNWLRRQIGTVAQEPILFSNTVAENIRYGRHDAKDADVEAAARAANAHDFVTSFPQGYATLVGERGIQLSGGQKQRVAIARAVLKNPRVLVLDEATSALDAESEHLVKEALDRLMHGRTTLIIAHRLSTVKDADRVLVLEGGKVVQAGSHHELLEQGGLYKRLVERQFVAG